jgi:hypothetical protein
LKNKQEISDNINININNELSNNFMSFTSSLQNDITKTDFDLLQSILYGSVPNIFFKISKYHEYLKDPRFICEYTSSAMPFPASNSETLCFNKILPFSFDSPMRFLFDSIQNVTGIIIKVRSPNKHLSAPPSLILCFFNIKQDKPEISPFLFFSEAPFFFNAIFSLSNSPLVSFFDESHKPSLTNFYITPNSNSLINLYFNKFFFSPICTSVNSLVYSLALPPPPFEDYLYIPLCSPQKCIGMEVCLVPSMMDHYSKEIGMMYEKEEMKFLLEVIPTFLPDFNSQSQNLNIERYEDYQKDEKNNKIKDIGKNNHKYGTVKDMINLSGVKVPYVEIPIMKSISNFTSSNINNSSLSSSLLTKANIHLEETPFSISKIFRQLRPISPIKPSSSSITSSSSSITSSSIPSISSSILSNDMFVPSATFFSKKSKSQNFSSSSSSSSSKPNIADEISIIENDSNEAKEKLLNAINSNIFS